MKHAKFVTTALAIAAVLGGVPVFAFGDAPAAPSATPSSAIIAPEVVDNEMENAPIAGSSFTKNFNIQSDYGWVTVWVQNTSSETLTVRVTQGSLTGTQKMLFTVAPGGTITEYGTKPWSTSTHWVSISTKNGGNMSGLLSVKLANTKEELQ